MANKQDLATGIVASLSGTTLIFQTGYGTGMPPVPFYLTLTPPGQLSTMGNSEVVYVTDRPGTADTFTVVRAQKGTSSKTVVSGWVAGNGIYTDDVYDQAPLGSINAFAGITPPSSNWLLAYGQAVSRTTYAGLWNTLKADLAGLTITIASPAVVTKTGHNLRTGDQIYFSTTGALPTGITANNPYYANVIDANTFRISTTRQNSYSAVWVNTSGTQSGTHSAIYAPWGIGDGSTTFNLPDLRGRTLAGKDDMGGTGANLLTGLSAGGMRGFNIGDYGGEQSHQLTIPELARVTGNWSIHGQENGTEFAGISGYATGSYTGIYTNTTPRGGGAGSYVNPGFAFGNDNSHNNIQPTIIMNYIIKALQS